MISEVTSTLFAGLGLFFVGVKFVGGALKQMSGRRVRALISTAVGNPVRAGALGVVAGALTQSTNAVTFILASMGAAGLLTVAQALPVIAWANVGTAGLVMVSSIDIHEVVFYLLGLVGLSYFLDVDKSARFRYVAAALLGISLLFLGLQLIKLGAAPLKNLPEFRDGMAVLATYPAVLFASSAAITIVLQSSSTVSTVAVAMAVAGLLPLEQTVILIYGSGVGSGLSLLFLSGNLQGAARQLALIQVLVKLVSGIVMVALLVLETWLGIPLVLAALRALADTVALQAAWSFLATQVAGALLGAAFAPTLLRLAERWAPPSLQETLSRPRFLNEYALDDPATALELVDLEQGRLVSHLPHYLRGSDAPATGDSQVLGADGTTLHAADSAVGDRIGVYLTDVLSRHQDRECLERSVVLQDRNRLLADLRESALEFETWVTRAEGTEDPHQPFCVDVVNRMREATQFLLVCLDEAASKRDAEDLALLQTLASDRSDTLDDLRQSWLGEASGISQPMLEALYNATAQLERVVWIVRRYSQTLAPREAS